MSNTCEAICKSGNKCNNKVKYEFNKYFYCGVHCKDSNRIKLNKFGDLIIFDKIKEKYLNNTKILFFKILDIIKIDEENSDNIKHISIHHNRKNKKYEIIFICNKNCYRICEHINKSYIIYNCSIEDESEIIHDSELDEILKYYNDNIWNISIYRDKCIFFSYIRTNSIKHEQKINNSFFKSPISNLDIILFSKLYDIIF
uniref:Uncharacterized protein n=1 Tax=Pithovirus LCDPAC02 TaxID=2506601 RepID=A0A481YR35_9VIRU|nr:MAG: hypothetical protein LCDPAC02_00950 [Pithovirus LCDPAC02]